MTHICVIGGERVLATVNIAYTLFPGLNDITWKLFEGHIASVVTLCYMKVIANYVKQLYTFNE